MLSIVKGPGVPEFAIQEQLKGFLLGMGNHSVREAKFRCGVGL